MAVLFAAGLLASAPTAGADQLGLSWVTDGILLPVSLKRMADNTVVASYTKALRVVATSRRVVSTDGKVMTITTTSRDPSGKPVTNVGVYERQQ